MLYRYKPLMDTDIIHCIIRDADSEINERDRWCIDDFINNTDESIICQVIRDHYWHKSKITGGLTFFKMRECDITQYLKLKFVDIFNNFNNSEKSNQLVYGSDEQILNESIYPLINNNIIIYSNICVFSNEKYKNIDFINNGTNFCGNVIEYIKKNNEKNEQTYEKKYNFNYFDFNFLEQLKWLIENNQYDVLLKLIDEYNNHKSIPYEEYIEILNYKLSVYIKQKNLCECMNIFKNYYKYFINKDAINNSKLVYDLARELGYKIKGTCDVNIEPKDKEIIIYYGNYPDDYLGYPQSNKIYKHIYYKDEIVLDDFISHPCWDKIDKIYIMTLENEFERVNETMLQLSYMNTPLD
jgi:hypothetical protein